jgi:protein gp37
MSTDKTIVRGDDTITSSPMSTHSSIEWTTRTWNPVVGCTMVSPGCAHCYAERMSMRLARMAKGETRPGRKAHYLRVINDRGRWNDNMEPVEEALDDPLHWKQPSTIFVNSMSDLFHEGVDAEFIDRVFDVMNRAHWHQFQILTKRSERLLELSSRLHWTPNIWQGVSVESDAYFSRIDDLRRTGARIKFLSLEPLLGPLRDMNLTEIHWAIVGGESGPGCRKMAASWVRDIRLQCMKANVSFFFKQWGHIRNNPHPSDPTAKENGGTAKGGRQLDGALWDQMPLQRHAELTPISAST